MFFDPRFLKSGGTGGGAGSGVAHDTYPPGQIHTPFNWIVADSAAKAAIVPVAADVYKILYQIDTDTVYVLEDDSPITWVAIGGGSSVGAVEIPVFKAFRATTNQSIGVGSLVTKVQLNGELFDSHGAFDAVTNFRFQPTSSGYYQLNHQIYIAAQAGTTLGGDNFGLLRKNGADYSRGARGSIVSSTCAMAGSDIVYFNGTTDYVELFINSDCSGGTGINLISGAVGLVSYLSGIKTDGKLSGAGGNASNQLVAFGASMSAGQVMANNTITKLNFDTKLWDIGGNYDTTNKRFVAPIAGIYEFNVELQGNTAAFSAGYIMLYKNGVEYRRVQQLGSGNLSALSGYAQVDLIAGDYIEAYASTSPANTMHNTVTYTYFSGALVKATNITPSAVTPGASVATTVPAFAAYANVGTVIPANIVTKVLFQVERYDTDNQFTGSTFTCTIPGIYHFSGRVGSATTNGGVSNSIIAHNGVDELVSTQTQTNSGAWDVSGDIKLAIGDTVELKMYSTVGFTTNVAGAYVTYFQGRLARADNPTVVVAETVPAPVSFQNRGGANQSLTAATETKITFDTATNTYNYGNGYNAATSTFTAPKDGVYHFETQVAAPFVAGSRVTLRKNGNAYALREVNTTEVTVDFQCDMYLATNDIVEVYARNPGAINTAKFSVTNFFQGYLLASGVLPTAVAPRHIETLKRSTDKSIPNNVTTSVDWTTETEVVAGAFNIAQPTRITVPGGYTKAKVKSSIIHNTAPAGARAVAIYRNNEAFNVAADYTVVSAIGYVVTATETEWLNVISGDYFEARAYQGSGGALNVICGGASFIGSYFEAEFR